MLKETSIKRTIAIVFTLIAFVVCGCSNGTGQQTSDEASIRNVYEGYTTALLNRGGDQAVKYVTNSTIEYYGDMKQMALTASEDEVKNLSTVDKIMVLTLRLMIDPHLLSEMTAEDLFIYGVNEGLIGEEDVANADIGDINIYGNTATAVYINNGQPTPLEYEFMKDNGQWKMDLTSIIPIVDLALHQAISSSGYDEYEFIILALEIASGKKVSDNIWQPLIQNH